MLRMLLKWLNPFLSLHRFVVLRLSFNQPKGRGFKPLAGHLQFTQLWMSSWYVKTKRRYRRWRKELATLLHYAEAQETMPKRKEDIGVFFIVVSFYLFIFELGQHDNIPVPVPNIISEKCEKAP